MGSLNRQIYDNASLKQGYNIDPQIVPNKFTQHSTIGGRGPNEGPILRRMRAEVGYDNDRGRGDEELRELMKGME